MRLLKPTSIVRHLDKVNSVLPTLVAVDHILLDYHRASIDGCKGLRLAPCIPYAIRIFSAQGRMGLYSQDMACEEVLIPDKFRILRPCFSILSVDEGIGCGYKDNL